MKEKEKKMILILIVVAVLIVGVIYLLTRPHNKKKETSASATQNINKEEFVNVLADGTKLNNSTKLGEMKKFEGLEIGNIQLTNNGDKTELIANVTNKIQKDTQAMLVDIVLYDKDGQQIATLGGYIAPVKAGKTMQFSTTAMRDYANAYDFKIVKK